MAESHVVSGLTAKRAELTGLVEHHQAEVNRLKEQLAHIDATLKIFDPSIDLRTLRKKAVRREHETFDHGETSRLCLEACKRAGGKLSNREIADHIIQAKAMEPTQENLEKVKRRVATTMRRLEGRGHARACGEDEAGAILWELTLV